MDMTKNERKTLTMLLENAKTSDIVIADKLGISSQAVGKIRKKLEGNVINSYSLNLDYARLGIHTFAMSLSRITPEGLDEGELEIEQKLLKEPNIINVYRLPSGSYTHIIFYGFKDMSDLENFFHSLQKKQEIHKYLDNRELFTFSHNSLIKNDSIPLFHKIINDISSIYGAGKNGGLTLTAGVYKWSTGVTIPTDVTLSGNSTDVWIFQIAQTLDISSATSVLLSGGALAKNIFWQVAGQTTLGTTSNFKGNILDQTAVVVNTGAVLSGRALAQTAVTLDGNTVSLPPGVTVVDDIIPPAVTLNTVNNTWTNDNQTALNFTFFDVNSTSALCSLFINGIGYNSSLNTTNNVATLITPNATLAEGAHSWYVTCIDVSGNTGTSVNYTIFINDVTTAPILSSISSTSITYSGATITWTTNEGANSTVYYGTTVDTLSMAVSSSLATSHSIALSLSADTLYYYNVSSCDPSGNCVTSGTYNFTTLSAPVTTSSGNTNSGNGGSGGGSGGVTWNCGQWSACSSTGKSTRMCWSSNSGITSTEERSCVPSAVVTPVAQTPVKTEESPAATPDAASDEGNLLTGQAVGQSTGTEPLPFIVSVFIMLGIVGLIMGGYYSLMPPKKLAKY